MTYDLRKDEPYLVYPEFDFEVPYTDRGRLLGAVHRPDGGDAAEPPASSSRPSKRLPSGPVNVPIAEKFPLPDKLTTYNSMEGLIQHFELIMPNRGFETPARRGLRGGREPQRRAGLLPRRRRQPDAWRVRTRPPSFIHFAVFPHMIKDHLLADVVAVLGSLNIIAAELDR